MALKLSKLQHETRGLKLFPFFTLMGWLLIGASIFIGVSVLASTGSTYWGGNAKAVRDAAEVGSPLLGDLATLAYWARLLPPLVFLGVASFMVGIAMEFAAIPAILDRRAAVLKRALPMMGHE
jgi:hypothetical protein